MVVLVRIGLIPSHPTVKFAARTPITRTKRYFAATQSWAQNILQDRNPLANFPRVEEHIRKDSRIDSHSSRESEAPLGNKITCAFVYGSVARREERATSDVDLMVIGRAGLADLAPALRKAGRRLGREINVTNYSRDEFRKKVTEGDHFLKTVLKGDLQFVKGEQRDLDAVTGK